MNKIYTIHLQSSLSGVMSEDEILNSISPEVMARIKAVDEHPFFQAFVTVHEGTGRPEVINDDNRPITWTRAAIRSVWGKIKGIIQAFKGHENGTNDTNGRKPIGQIVGQSEKEIDGKLSHISIFYHPPGVKEEAASYDACSHEGEWSLEDDNQGGFIARALEKLQAVGFLKRGETPPALSGTLKIGAVQAHKSPGNGEGLTPPGKGKDNNKMELKDLTFQDIVQKIKELNIHPSQLYTIEQISNDRSFSDFFDENKRVTEENKTLKTQVETLGNEKTALSLEKDKITLKPRFKQIIEKTKLTPEMKTFIEQKFDKTTFTDFTEEHMNEFIKNQSAEFTSFAKLVKGEPPESPPGDPKDFLGGDPPKKSEQFSNGDIVDKFPDYSIPENNDIFNGIDLKDKKE